MAIENGVQNAELGYILDPAFQIENINGKPAVGGHIEIFEAGTDNKYISYQNFDGAQNPFKIPLGSDGRAVILGDPSLLYDVYAYDSYNNLMFSRLNVQCNVPGNISIKGADTRINNTDGTLDISLRTLGNNVRQYTINTHNKILDCQAPLYFVENSETATVIGFSGDNYATTADLADKMDVNKLEYNENGEISAYDGSAFAGQGGAGDPEVNDLVHSNSATWNDVSAKLDTTAFSTVSGNFLTAIPDNYATKDYVQSSVSSKLDTTAFSTVSGNFLTAHQDLSDYLTKASADALYQPKGDYAPAGDYATHDDLTAYQPVGDYYSASNPSGFITNDAITGLQPSGDYATHDDLTAYATTSLVSSVSSELYSAISGISGDYELVAGEGVELVDDPNAKTTTINVTAEGTPVTAIEQMIESATSGLQPSGDYATTAQVADKLDTTAFSNVSGSFLTAHQSLDGYATTEDVESAVSSKLDTTAFSTVSGSFLTAHQDLSDYATTAELAEKLDTTAFSDVSGTFLTAHQDISNKLDTTAFSDVSGSFLTAVPDTYLQNTDLSTEDGKVTAISGIPLSAGGDVPEGVMVESGLEYNAVNEISGYNGSAISQYGAEKQWLVHDDTLVHAANSAQYALGVAIDNVARLMGCDRTVLFENWESPIRSTTATGSLSEPLTSFDSFEITWAPWGNMGEIRWEPITQKFKSYPASNSASYYTLFAPWLVENNQGAYLFMELLSANDTNFCIKEGKFYQFRDTVTGENTSIDNSKIYKIVGVGRKQ